MATPTATPNATAYVAEIRRSLLAILLIIAACGDDDGTSAGDRRAAQARDAAIEAGLPDDVADFLGDAAAGVDATYRVAYDIADGRRLEVTQRPPDRRVDVVATDGTVDATINADRTTYQCHRDVDGSWRCDELGEPARPDELGFAEAAIEAFTASLTAGASAFDFAVEARSLLGVDARCLVTTARAGDATGELCISPTGAVLLVERPGDALRAVEYTTAVADDAFDLPARPTGPGRPG